MVLKSDLIPIQDGTENGGGLTGELHEYASGQMASPKLWADAWLLAFAHAAEGTLITFDRALAARGAVLLESTLKPATAKWSLISAQGLNAGDFLQGWVMRFFYATPWPVSPLVSLANRRTRKRCRQTRHRKASNRQNRLRTRSTDVG